MVVPKEKKANWHRQILMENKELRKKNRELRERVKTLEREVENLENINLEMGEFYDG